MATPEPEDMRTDDGALTTLLTIHSRQAWLQALRPGSRVHIA